MSGSLVCWQKPRRALHSASDTGRKRAQGTVLRAAFTLVFTSPRPRELGQDQGLHTLPSPFLQPLQQLGCEVCDDDVGTWMGNRNRWGISYRHSWKMTVSQGKTAMERHSLAAASSRH